MCTMLENAFDGLSKKDGLLCVPKQNIKLSVLWFLSFLEMLSVHSSSFLSFRHLNAPFSMLNVQRLIGSINGSELYDGLNFWNMYVHRWESLSLLQPAPVPFYQNSTTFIDFCVENFAIVIATVTWGEGRWVERKGYCEGFVHNSIKTEMINEIWSKPRWQYEIGNRKNEKRL